MQEKNKSKVEYDHDTLIRLLTALPTKKENISLLKVWENELFAKGVKQSSINHYIQSLYILLKWKPDKLLANFSRQDIINFKKHLTTTTYNRNGSVPRKYSSTTINSYLMNTRELFKWQKKPKVMDWFKADSRQAKGRLKAEEIITHGEILKLVNAANSKRDEAIIWSLWESGCRASEFLGLKIGNLNIQDNHVTFTISGKTGERQCFLVESMAAVLSYIETRHDKGDSTAWLWAKWKGQQLKINGLQRMLKETAKRANLNKPCFPHALRHSRATYAATRKMNEMVMRKIFGWSKTSDMPSVYVSLAGKDTKAAVLEMAGIKEAEDSEPETKKCLSCGTIAALDQNYCKQCNTPLNAESIMEQREEQATQIKKLIEIALNERKK